ncbi:unnamed protein product [Owenia fusiformis]|uniref:Cupin-like domain-containing protein n=1 Tax=Owenia fusiformis TaxID=6347 RepID=A0A8J1XYC3_OWEFU|nr:unnamed protein product [Owenia fusiformis]
MIIEYRMLLTSHLTTRKQDMESKSNPSPSLEEKLAKEIKDIKDKATKDGLTKREIRELFLNYVKSQEAPKSRCNFGLPMKILLVSLLPIILAIATMVLNAEFDMTKLKEDFIGSKCLVDNNAILMEAARPLVECDVCKNLKQVPIVYDLDEKTFVEKYAYSNVPALVKGATKNWTAMDTFSFKFLKDIYTKTPDALQSVEEECQFFPYKTEFHTLEEVFEMPEARANFEEGQKNWYIGWSNCNGDVAEILRKHYQRPHFLPKDSESSSLDWLFMGGSGPGAFVHLDYVQRPSWQAQIKGRKSWTLVPVPECEHVCVPMNITVEKGDIILIDTNQWYHSTFVHPGEISITIGSEYD